MAKRVSKSGWDYHHRKARSKGKPECCGMNDDINISLVPRNLHIAFHQLFRNYDAHQIAKILNDVWLEPDFYFIVKKKGN